jgi:RNA polymerase sigma-32 factor
MIKKQNKQRKLQRIKSTKGPSAVLEGEIVNSVSLESADDASSVEEKESVVEDITLGEVEDIVDFKPDELLPTVSEEEKTVGLTRYDALTSYLKEVGRYPRLTKEEEMSLAVKYHNSKDIEAAYKLVSSNLWLVIKIAREYERAARSLLDLVQEGNIGLMEAVKNFDPYRGVRFPSYAVWWIKAFIIRFVIANWRMVKLGTTQAQRKLFFNLNKEKERLEKEGIYPGPKLLAEKLNVKENDVIEMEQRLASSDVSVDTPFSEDSDSTLLSMLPSHQPSAEELVSFRQRQEALSKNLEGFSSTLNAKELLIFRSRLLAEEKATLQDLSEKLNISKERVRQLEERIKAKLKTYLIDNLGETLGEIEIES